MNTLEFITTMSSDPDARAAWIASVDTADVSCEFLIRDGEKVVGVEDFIVNGTKLDSVVLSAIAARDSLQSIARDVLDVALEMIPGDLWRDGLSMLAKACALSCEPISPPTVETAGVVVTVDGREIPATL